MRLYDELADWWPILSQPADYQEEAGFFHQVLAESCRPAARTMLELGSGGGNNAFHLKAHYAMTLTDVSKGMLAVSQALNPECEHLEGDMRTLRLDRCFDAVFVHDAIDYMTSESDLRAAIRTAFLHCRAGGVVLFVPDYVRETFAPSTEQGGHDADRRGLRYLEWTFDPDPADATYVADFAIMLRDEVGEIRVVHDRHEYGLFARADWLRLLQETGFEAHIVPDRFGRDLFVGKRAG